MKQITLTVILSDGSHNTSSQQSVDNLSGRRMTVNSLFKLAADITQPFAPRATLVGSFLAIGTEMQRYTASETYDLMGLNGRVAI